jgi:hypothetical protein
VLVGTPETQSLAVVQLAVLAIQSSALMKCSRCSKLGDAHLLQMHSNALSRNVEVEALIELRIMLRQAASGELPLHHRQAAQ